MQRKIIKDLISKLRMFTITLKRERMVQQDRPLVMQLLYWKMTLNLKGQLREMNSRVRQT